MNNKFEKVEASRSLEGSINNKFSYSIDQGDLLNLDYEKITEILNSDIFNDKKINFNENKETDEIIPKIIPEIFQKIRKISICGEVGTVGTVPEVVQLPIDCWGFEVSGSSGNVIRISNSNLGSKPAFSARLGYDALFGGCAFIGTQGPQRFPRQKGISELYFYGSAAQTITVAFYCGSEPSQSDLLAWL